jgi:hypothetical protein
VGALTPFDLAKPGIAGQSQSPCILPNSIFWQRQINIIHSCQNAAPQALDLCEAGRFQKINSRKPRSLLKNGSQLSWALSDAKMIERQP